MTSKLIYYVYAYLRSKDSKTAKAGTPYYIGKGMGRRAYNKHGHIPSPKEKSNIVFLEVGLTESDSFILEIAFIVLYGRKDLKTGILLNATDGGEGARGAIRSIATRSKISYIHLGKQKGHQSTEHRAAISAVKLGVSRKPFSDVHRAALGRNDQGRPCTIDQIVVYKSRKDLINALGSGRFGLKHPSFRYLTIQGN